MKTVMLHMKLPDDLAEVADGKDLKAEVSAALRSRWFSGAKKEDTFPMCVECSGTYAHHEDCSKITEDQRPFMIRKMDRNTWMEEPSFPTYGSIPAEQKQ